MSRSIIIFLTFFMIVSVAWRIDAMKSARTIKRITPKEFCVSKGYEEVCSDTADDLCANVRCRSSKIFVSHVGRAPNNMWCGDRKICNNGKCESRATGSARSPLFNFKQC